MGNSHPDFSCCRSCRGGEGEPEYMYDKPFLAMNLKKNENLDKNSNDNINKSNDMILVNNSNNEKNILNSSNKINFKSTNNIGEKSIQRIQSLFRGHKTRQKFKEFGIYLNKEESLSLKKKELEFIPKITLENEKKFKEPLDVKENWKKFYNEKSYESLLREVSSNYGGQIQDNEDELYYSKGCFLNYNLINGFYRGFLNKEYKMHGKGELYLKTGEKYEGIFINGLLNGWGRYVSPSGHCYEGFFIKGKLNGKGQEIYNDEKGNEIVYIGMFNNFIKTGRGSEESETCIFEGVFHNNKKNGKGKLKYKNSNESYDGEFINDTINGFGHYIWSNDHEYIGVFRNAKMNGKGEYRWPDGSRYVGMYINNIKEGQGEFFWPDGRHYVGDFKQGKPHGKGKITIKGITIDCEFENGQYVGDLKEALRSKRREMKKLMNQDNDKDSVSVVSKMCKFDKNENISNDALK